ncbi:MAG: hypothetical protein IPL14_18055 [Nitrospira sp.]|nr:hypothetical protein [Nitrospira sp.]
MTMIHRAIPTAVALTAVLSISCASPPPSQEKLGKSLTAMKAAQIAAADGRRNDRSGLDGRAAQMVMRGYLGTYDRSQDGGGGCAAADATRTKRDDQRRNAFDFG